MVSPPTNPLHLLRSLLRECTYLPDPRARSYMHNYVLWSYRTYLPKPAAWRKPIEFKRQVRLLHRGRKWLSMLQRANKGYLKPLEKVLMMSYGRTGKRKRELMQKLMAPEPPQTSEEVATFSVPKPYVKDWKPPAKVDALMRSQAKHQAWCFAWLRIKASTFAGGFQSFTYGLGTENVATSSEVWGGSGAINFCMSSRFLFPVRP